MADDEIRNVLREVERTQARVTDAPEGFVRILRDGVLTLDLDDVDAWVQDAGGRVESETLAAPPLVNQEDGVTPEVKAPEVAEYYLVPESALRTD
jgi:hypothetical protein